MYLIQIAHMIGTKFRGEWPLWHGIPSPASSLPAFSWLVNCLILGISNSHLISDNNVFATKSFIKIYFFKSSVKAANQAQVSIQRHLSPQRRSSPRTHHYLLDDCAFLFLTSSSPVVCTLSLSLSLSLSFVETQLKS